MTFDWNSSAKFEYGHHRSNVTPPNRGFCPPENSNTCDFDEIETLCLSILFYIPWPFPPVWGVADNTKETTKTIGVSLRSSSNDEGSQPSLDGTAGATQPILPRLPQLTSLHRCRLPYCPYHRAASTRQPHGNSRCQSELRHNHSPLIPIPSTLTCLPYIHPPINQGSLYSIHPPKPRPPSSISPVNFCIHYLFQ